MASRRATSPRAPTPQWSGLDVDDVGDLASTPVPDPVRAALTPEHVDDLLLSLRGASITMEDEDAFFRRLPPLAEPDPLPEPPAAQTSQANQAVTPDPPAPALVAPLPVPVPTFGAARPISYPPVEPKRKSALIGTPEPPAVPASVASVSVVPLEATPVMAPAPKAAPRPGAPVPSGAALPPGMEPMEGMANRTVSPALSVAFLALSIPFGLLAFAGGVALVLMLL